MAKLYILLDSSTKPRETKWGESVAAWSAWWGESETNRPIRVGIYYFFKDGPNVTFYKGVIGALQQCKELVNRYDEVVLYGDCDLVIKQINNEWNHKELTKYFNQVSILREQYPCKVAVNYISEKNSIYKAIDQLSKRSLDFIKKSLSIPKI